MKKIILADDDPSIQESAKMILERVGYEVTGMLNGDTLFDGDYELPDLYILDKQLSGVDGLDICNFLKHGEKTKNIPVLMLSASPHISRLAHQAGADDFLEKPFKMTALREMVGRLIDS